MIMSTAEKFLNFTAAVNGFHYYQKLWSPKKEEILNWHHERDNAFNVFVIKTKSKNGSMVEHLPREVSWITKFILDWGAKVTATLSSTNFRRSPLVQEGLEINHMILDRFKELINDYYAEPTDEEILGFFLAIISHDSPVRKQEIPPFQRKKEKLSNSEISVPDIREMFRRQAENGQRNERKNNNKVIVID